MLDASNIKIISGHDGTFSFITRDVALVKQAKDLFGRRDQKDLAVKIFHHPIPFDDTEIKRFRWGKYFDFDTLPKNAGGSLYDAIRVQNLFAMKDLAPRVYGVFQVESKYKTVHWALLMDDAWWKDIVSLKNEDVYERLKPIAKELGVTLPFGDMWSENNVMGHKWVDWQGAGFGENYMTLLTKRYLDKTYFGESKYQTVPELGIEEGIRKTETRVNDLGIMAYDYTGLTVIDVGCSGGMFLNRVMEMGAKYAVGLDWKRVVEGAKEVSNYLGNFNIDYLPAELHKALPQEVMDKAPFDFVFYMSMITHTGVPEYLHKLGKNMILEINHPHQIDETLKALEPHWECAFIGKATEHGDREIYHCKSKFYE